jgi:tetratricopeptide (TPR) repeat protein
LRSASTRIDSKSESSDKPSFSHIAASSTPAKVPTDSSVAKKPAKKVHKDMPSVAASPPSEVAPSTATAVTDSLAVVRNHYLQGTSYFDLGRYQDAIKEFEAAYELKSDPAFLYNLAQSHRLAGNAEQALRFYRVYLRRAPQAANRADIESKIATLEQLIAQKEASPK